MSVAEQVMGGILIAVFSSLTSTTLLYWRMAGKTVSKSDYDEDKKERAKLEIKEEAERTKDMNNLEGKMLAKISDIMTARSSAWSNHGRFCPENRNVMTEEEHRKVCMATTSPIIADVAEIKEVVKSIQKRQQRTLTINHVNMLLRSISKIDGGKIPLPEIPDIDSNPDLEEDGG